MPRRNIVLAENEIYHVFNRGIMKLPIYLMPSDYLRFLELIAYYRFSNTPTSYSDLKKFSIEKRNQILEELKKKNMLQVEIFAYCLMPNHFHFVVKQINKNGISTFMSNILNGYTKYFNIKNNRIGPLYQSSFKVVRIETDEQFLHTCRYVHLNPSTSFLVKSDLLEKYKWSSYPYYIENNSTETFLNTKELLSFFKNKRALQDFTLDQADYQKSLAQIKHLFLD